MMIIKKVAGLSKRGNGYFLKNAIMKRRKPNVETLAKRLSTLELIPVCAAIK